MDMFFCATTLQKKHTTSGARLESTQRQAESLLIEILPAASPPLLDRLEAHTAYNHLPSCTPTLLPCHMPKHLPRYMPKHLSSRTPYWTWLRIGHQQRHCRAHQHQLDIKVCRWLWTLVLITGIRVASSQLWPISGQGHSLSWTSFNLTAHPVSWRTRPSKVWDTI